MGRRQELHVQVVGLKEGWCVPVRSCPALPRPFILNWMDKGPLSVVFQREKKKSGINLYCISLLQNGWMGRRTKILKGWKIVSQDRRINSSRDTEMWTRVVSVRMYFKGSDSYQNNWQNLETEAEDKRGRRDSKMMRRLGLRKITRQRIIS